MCARYDNIFLALGVYIIKTDFLHIISIMISLCLTSFLFSTTIIHAFYTGNAFYHHLMLGVTLLSVAFHHHRLAACRTAYTPLQFFYCKVLRTVDKIMAHVAFILFTLEIMNSIDEEGNNLWLLAFPFLIAVVWFLECGSKYDNLLHASLHILSILAVHCIIRGQSLAHKVQQPLPVFH
jgi:hypothetical protein